MGAVSTGQMLREMMDPGTDMVRATESAQSSARTGLRAQLDGMMGASRQRLGEARERELATANEIANLRASQAVRWMPPRLYVLFSFGGLHVRGLFL
jgi:hypothetical protein